MSLTPISLGPLDGAEASRRVPWAWLRLSRAGVSVKEAPGDGRALYRLTPTGYVHAAGRYDFCADCGVYVERPGSCFCGQVHR